MAKIPLKAKIGLINNYIQTNYLKSRGKTEHEEWLVTDILNEIKEDLSTLEKERTTEHVPLGLITRDLKHLQDRQSSLRNGLGSIIDQLTSLLEETKTIQESQRNPESDLAAVIKNLEDIVLE